MIQAVYLILPFLMAFPAGVAFVKWRNLSFKSKTLAFEFFGFFAFFFFNALFAYQYLYGNNSYQYIFKIFVPFFFLFFIQKDLSCIEKTRLKKLLILISENAFFQIMVYKVTPGIYIHELLELLTLLFAVYVTFRIGLEYHITVYVPKLSRYMIIALGILCILFDVYIFKFLLISAIFYASLEKRQLELSDLQKVTENLLIGQNRFRSMMNELSSSIKDFSNKKDAADSYLGSLCRFLSVRGAAIYEWNGDKKHFSCIAIAGLYFPLGIGSEKLFTRPDLLREMAFKQYIRDYKSIIWKCGHSEDRQGMLLSHSTDDMDVLLGNLSQEVHSLILLPLLQDTDLLGVLVLENKIGRDYLTEADFSMAKNFANFAAIILSTSRIAEQRSENLRMATELNTGNVVQSSLFSKTLPSVPGIEVSFFMLPAKEIGGDYYDFIENGDNLAVVIGDVSGKGVSAGILVAIVQTFLQNQYKKTSDLKKIIIALNNYLYNKISTGMFVTLLFFEWDSRENKLHYVSCGHEHILHYRAKDKTIKCIRSGGLALMMDSDIEPYILDNELSVEEGDSVILYTDGVIETFNADKEIFGLERLVKFFEKNSDINKNTIGKLLPQTLLEWRGDTNQTDDTTCVLMQF